MHVASLHVYPVKALRGSAVADAEVEEQGLRHDRRWMMVDENGDKVGAVRTPTVFSVTARPGPDGSLDLQTEGRDDLHVPVPVHGTPVPVTLSRVGTALDAGAEADAWLSDALGRAVRLVWMSDPRQRPMSLSHGGLPGEVLSLADTGPLLLTSMSSLRRLERWVADAFAERYAACGRAAGTRPAGLGMERFRPNVVVDGDLEPFVEDGWGEVVLGDVVFRVSELCDRCPVPGFDPRTGTMDREPLRSLAKHRRWDGRTWFGVRLVPVTTGTIRVGDRVRATTGTPPRTTGDGAGAEGPAAGPGRQVAFDR